MIQSQTIDLGEVQIHYAEAPGPGPALVILHGLTGALDTFGPLLAAWPARWLYSSWKPQAAALP